MQLLDQIRDRILGRELKHPFASLASYFFPVSKILPGVLQGSVHGFGSWLGGDESAHAILHNFAVAADVGHDRDAFVEHGIQQNQRHAFHERGHEQGMVVAPDGFHVGLGELPIGIVEEDICESLALDSSTEGGLIGAVAVKVELDVPVAPFFHGENLDGDVLALVDVQQTGRHREPDGTVSRWKRQALGAVDVEWVVENAGMRDSTTKALLKQGTVVL